MLTPIKIISDGNNEAIQRQRRHRLYEQLCGLAFHSCVCHRFRLFKMLKACLLVVFLATCTSGNYPNPDVPQDESEPFQTGGVLEDDEDIPDWYGPLDEENDEGDAVDEDIDPEDIPMYEDGDLTNPFDQIGLQDVSDSEDVDLYHGHDSIDDNGDTSSEDDDDETAEQPMFYQPNMWPFVNGFKNVIPGIHNPWYNDGFNQPDQDDSSESDNKDSYDDEPKERQMRSWPDDYSSDSDPTSSSDDESESEYSTERETRSLSDDDFLAALNVQYLGDEFDDEMYGYQDDYSSDSDPTSSSDDESEYSLERETRSLSDDDFLTALNAEYLGDNLDNDLYGYQGEDLIERETRAVSFVPRIVRLGLAALKGKRIRQTLLRGTTVMRRHGRTTHYEKPGTSNTMLKDFYSSNPTNIKDDVIDGAYVGKIGTVGDRKIHYFLHDDEHVYLKPLLSIQKMDKEGNVLVKDVIHYTSN